MPRSLSVRWFDPRLFGVFIVCALLLPIAIAQNPTDPATLRITQLDLRPGYNADFSALQKEVLIPFYERSGYPFVGVYRVRFGDGVDYAIVSPIDMYDVEGKTTEAGTKRFRETQRQILQSSRSYVQRKLTDLSYGEATAEPVPHLSVSHITLAPGKRGEFIKNLKQTALPRWKKMGIPSVVTWEIIYGYNTGQFVIVVPIESYGDLANGTPFYRGMSEAERMQLLSGMQGVIVDIERVVADFMPDLSWTPEQ